MQPYVRLFGTPSVELGGKVYTFPSLKASRLLFYLAYRGEWTKRSFLAELFRPEADTETARHYLRLMIARAHKMPFAQTLEVEADELRWAVGSDVADFKLAVGRGDLRSSVGLYKAPLLLWQSGDEAYESWLEDERRALHESWRRSALVLVRELTGSPALELLERLLTDDDLSEEAVQLHLATCHELGERTRGLEMYRVFASRLERELGLKPLEETQALVAALKSAAPLRTVPKPLLVAPPLVVQPPLEPHELVGRHDTLALLRKTTARIALLSGEPGIGKTSLARHVAPDALYLRFPPGLSSVPYFPLLQHLREHFSDTQLPERYLLELLRFVPEGLPERVPPPFDPVLGQTLLLEAWARYLEVWGRARPFSFILDDVQWADGATLELVRYLAQRDGPSFMLSYRSTEVSPALQTTLDAVGEVASAVELEPLGEHHLSDLLASLIGTEAGPKRFSTWLFDRSGGNPFFALETLKALFEEGSLWREGDRWHSKLDALSKDYSELVIPGAVNTLVQKRLRGLSEGSQRLLPVAALVREPLEPDLLAGLTGLSSLTVADIFEEAEASGFIRAGKFSHDLIVQSLFESISLERRRLLHAKVAERLVGKVNAAAIADHYFLADDFATAATFWLKASRELSDQGLHRLAAELLEDKRGNLSGIPHEQLSIELAYLYDFLDDIRAESLVETLLSSSNSEIRAYARVVAASVALTHSDLIEAERHLERVGKIEDAHVQMHFAMAQAKWQHSQGRYEEVLQTLQPYLQARRPNRVARINAAVTLECLDRLEESLELYQQLLQELGQEGSNVERVYTVGNMLSCLIGLKRGGEGLALAETTLQSCPDIPLTTSGPLYNNLAVVHIGEKNYERALELLDQLLAGDITKSVRLMATGVLVRLHHLQDSKEKAYHLIDTLFTAIEHHEYIETKAHVHSIVLEYGSAEQKEHSRAELATFDLSRLPAFLRDDLEDLLANAK